jgi:thiamine-phosphate pyrophosphorylase
MSGNSLVAGAGAGAGAGAATSATVTAERSRRAGLLREAGVYLVTEESQSAGRTSEAIAEAALAAGIRAIQIREKDGTARRALEIALAIREMTRGYGALLIVNDRIDLALAVGADGVHLGQDDLPLDYARHLLGPDALIGLSITDASQLDGPDVAQADYLGVGSVFPTGSKADATLTGLPLLRASRLAVGAPIVAIGGIAADKAAAAVEAGADVLAVISAITQAADPGQAAATLLAVVRAGRSGAAGQSAGQSAEGPHS